MAGCKIILTNGMTIDDVDDYDSTVALAWNASRREGFGIEIDSLGRTVAIPLTAIAAIVREDEEVVA